MRIALILVLLASHVVAGHRAAATWTSDVELWGQAVRIAPAKPRPRLNYAVALIAAGRLQEARREIEIADQLLRLPGVTDHERALSAPIIESTMLLLSYAGIIEARVP
jgi:hypothetical protein